MDLKQTIKFLSRDENKALKPVAKTNKTGSEKLRAQFQVLNDIYGQSQGNSYEYGIAESCDEEDLEIKLQSLKQ